MKLIFRQITTFNEFLDIKEQWNRLVKTTDIDHSFMRHEWFHSWINHLKPESKLAIQTAWNNNELVGIAPLQIVREKRKSLPINLLSFLASSITPRCNFILDKSVDKTAFFDSLFSIPGWDVMELKSIEADHPLTAEFIRYLKLNKKYVIEEGIQSPFEIIETDWKSYLGAMSKNYKKNLRNYLNRLKKKDSFEIRRLENYDDFKNQYESLITVSGKSWKAEGGTDLKSKPQMAEFYREFCELGFRDKLFVMDILIIDNKTVAFNYYLRQNNRLVAIRWEYDEDYSYFMPGLVLHNYSLEQICGSAEKWEYDLSGDATSHKVRLMNNIRKHIDITIGRDQWRSRMLMMIKKILVRSSNITDEFD